MDKKQIQKRFGAKIEAKLVDVTPAMASRWLNNHNTHNRPLYQKVVDSYALDMKRGYWALNHQGICFSEEGVLLDGQHRLAAIIKSGVTIPLYVTRNMPTTYGSNGIERGFTQDTIDNPKVRSVGDRLHMSYGIQNANMVAAMTGIIIGICAPGKAQSKKSVRVTKSVYDLYQNEIEMVIDHKQHTRGLLVAPVTGSLAFAAKVYPAEVLDFEVKYFSGADLPANNPCLCFREWMKSKRPDQSGTHTRTIIKNYTLSALMRFIQDKKVKSLKISQAAFDFFINKQKKYVDAVNEELRL